MATYAITAPTGEQYQIDAPDNASQEDVLAYAQQNHVASQPSAGATLSSPKGPFLSAPTGIMQSQPGITLNGQTPDINQAVSSFPNQTQIPSGFDKYNAAERVMGGAALGLTQLANTGNQNIDQNLLAQTISNMDEENKANAGIGQFAAQLAFDPRNYMLALGGVAGLGARTAAGAAYGATDPIASADTGEQLKGRGQNALINALMFAGAPPVLNKTAESLGVIGSAIPNNIRINIPQVDTGGFFSNNTSKTPFTAIRSPAELPSDLQGLQPLVDANKSTMFNRSPNNLEVGLDANKAISAEFDKAKNVFNQNRLAVVQSGVEVPAGDFLPKINQIVSYLSNKIGEKGDTTAISRLQDIAEKVNPTVDYGTGQKNANIGIGDLIDFREGLNSALNDNKFLNKGDATIINAKSYVDNLLSRASEVDPSVAPKIQAYKESAQDIASRFTGNKALKPFWQPNDYIAYKANLNNPDLPAHGDMTLTRANKFLDNLNTENAGGISAVLNALPEDKAAEIARLAVINAKKQAPSGAKVAGIQLLAKQPLGAAKTLAGSLISSQPTPITTFAKNLKKMGTR